MALSPLLSFSILSSPPPPPPLSTKFPFVLHRHCRRCRRLGTAAICMIATHPLTKSTTSKFVSAACRISPPAAAATAGDGRTASRELPASSSSSSLPLRFSVQEACCSSHLHAAAALRARTFYNYPQERSLEARESHQKYMTAVEWRMLQSKVSGEEMGFGRVTCLVAVCSTHDLPKSSRGLLEAVAVLGEQIFVIGTLDLNQGRVLPGEIQGSRPHGGDADRCRGYLSNFCVAEETRRKGVGMALVREAKKKAKEWGIVDLYVHVVAVNNAAHSLYTKNGFTLETEESVSHAKALDRPRRLLLWTSLKDSSFF